MMAGIKNKDTKPEITIRKALYSQGFRYRLHDKNLPGKPDIILRKYKAVIFVNGCFWHKHSCHLFKWPKTRPEFWRQKITGNCERDIKTKNHLLKDNLRVLVIWECALKGKTKLEFSSLLSQVTSWIKSDTIYTEIGGHVTC